MKVSLNWLKEFVDLPEPPAEVAAQLLRQGFEVASMTPAGAEVPGVVVGLVESAQKHPNADKLKLCRVSDGKTSYQVVCGAPNVEVGRRYPFATLGARLPDGTVIQKRPLRGVESEGMLCSARELGLGDDHAGLYPISDDVSVGLDAVSALELNDVIFEVEVTPNRPDVLSHWGVARELAAGFRRPLRLPSPPVWDGPEQNNLVVLEDPALCSRYLATTLAGAKVGASPTKVRLRLDRCGIRPINNLVDATNYVLLELGHPTHVFDRARLRGRLAVRRGRPSETLDCLDGVSRSVDGTPVIADDGGPVAAAGVMGGRPTGVTESTVEVLLESARFDPAEVRRARRRWGISTESSFRFERGTDVTLAEWAARRGTELIRLWSGARVTGRQNEGASSGGAIKVSVSLAHLASLIGMDLGESQVVDGLKRFGFSISGHGDAREVTAPVHRADVRESCDVAEEVARAVGYDAVPSRVRSAPQGGEPPSMIRQLGLSARERLLAWGFWETVQTGLVPKSLWRRFAGEGGEEPAELLNPLSSSGECLNPSLMVNLLACAAGNVRRGNADVRLFEIARVFHRGTSGVQESDHLAWVALGRTHGDHWRFRPRSLEVWDARAWTKAIIKEWRLGDIRFAESGRSYLHPTQSQGVWRGDNCLGYYGRIHPRQAEEWGIPVDTFIGEINLTMAAAGPKVPVVFHGVSRLPAVVRDFSLVFPLTVGWASVVFWIHKEIPWVEGVELFDLYEGNGLPENTRSLAFRVTFRRGDRTLSEEEAHALHGKVLNGLIKVFGAALRGGEPILG